MHVFFTWENNDLQNQHYIQFSDASSWLTPLLNHKHHSKVRWSIPTWFDIWKTLLDATPFHIHLPLPKETSPLIGKKPEPQLHGKTPIQLPLIKATQWRTLGCHTANSRQYMAGFERWFYCHICKGMSVSRYTTQPITVTKRTLGDHIGWVKEMGVCFTSLLFSTTLFVYRHACCKPLHMERTGAIIRRYRTTISLTPNYLR